MSTTIKRPRKVTSHKPATPSLNGHAEAGQVVTGIPVSAIVPSPTNPRKTFDAAGLDELAASIKVHGVIQPVIVRPRYAAEDRERAARGGVTLPEGLYELVAGERRFRASKLAGKATIPAIVRELTDLEALEFQRIENLQRQDLGPAEEAAGYQLLLDDHGYTVEQIAAKLGKSTGYVYGRLKLARLPRQAAEALAAGELAQTTAQLLARIPSDEARDEATRLVLWGETHADDVPSWAELAKLQKAGGLDTPLSLRQTEDLVRRRYMVELKQAPFPQKDRSLVEGAGACTDCPKRTGNAKADYPGSRPDVCTDPTCYRKKCDAHRDRLLEAARVEGRAVLAPKEAAKLFNRYDPTRVNHDAPYVDLKEHSYQFGSGETWEKLVGKELADQVVLVVDPLGTLHRLVPRDAAEKLARGRQKDKPASNTEERLRAENRERERKAKRGKEAARRAAGLVADKLRSTLGSAVGWTPGAVELLRAVAAAVAEELWNDACRQVAKRRGLECPEGGYRAAVSAYARSLDSGPALCALIGELAAAKKSLDWGAPYWTGQMSAEDRAFWDAFGIDRKKVLSDVEREEKAKKKPEGKKKPPISPEQAQEIAQLAGCKCQDGARPASDPITRETFLIDLLRGADVSKAGRALEDAGVPTLGQLLDRCGTDGKGGSYSSHLFTFLRAIPGLGIQAAEQIGDALVDWGVVGAHGPTQPVSWQAPGGQS